MEGEREGEGEESEMKTKEIKITLRKWTDTGDCKQTKNLLDLLAEVPKSIYQTFFYKSTPPNEFITNQIPHWVSWHAGVIGGMSFRIIESYIIDNDSLSQNINLSCNSKTQILQIMRKRRKVR